MKVIKKNQIIISVIALMLVTAGYLNYTANNETIGTSSSNVVGNELVAEIGDAAFVSSGDIISAKDEVNSIIKENNSKSEAKSNTVDIDNNIHTEEIAETSSNIEDEYFSKSRIEREKMYSQTLENYQKMLENQTISEAQKTIATQEITRINNEKNAIMISENLIKTKGFKDCIIFINDKSVNVIIKSENLQQEEVAQIQNIISREIKAQIENIHITNK